MPTQKADHVPIETAAKPRPTLLPNVGDILFATILYLLLMDRPNYLFGDGGTGWHLATGHYILDHGTIPTTDFISYTYAGKPWMQLYWLGDLIMAAADRLAGLNGLALLSAAAIALLMLLLYRRARATGCHLVLSAAITGIGIIASTTHWLARPHIITFFGTYLFATALEDFHRNAISAKRLIITLIITTLLWTNGHPGFMAGFAIAVIYLVCLLAAALVNASAHIRQTALSKAKVIAVTLAACLAASIINPNGIALHHKLTQYLSSPQMLEMVIEYQSPKFHGDVQTTALELLFFLLLAGLVIRKTPLSIPQALTVFAFAHLALSQSRNISLFVLVALPFIAELLSFRQPALMPLSIYGGGGANAESGSNIDDRANFQAGESVDTDQALTVAGQKYWRIIVEKWSDLGKRMDLIENQSNTYLTSIVVLVAFTILVAMGGKPSGTPPINCGFSDVKFPTKTLEFAAKNLPAKKGFNEANWGGYIYYTAHMPIFIDDRSAFYGEDFYMQYASVINLAPGWREFLKQHDVEWIVFPKDQPFSQQLKTEPEWRTVSEDPAAIVFQRTSSESPVPHE